MFLDIDIEQSTPIPVCMPPVMRFCNDVIGRLQKRYEDMDDWEKYEVDALKLIMRTEYMLLMIASWYCECIIGEQAVIIMDHATIHKLERFFSMWTSGSTTRQ